MLVIDINLWFARDIHTDEIIQIIDAEQGNRYCCPICNSEAIPKALNSTKVTPHFAHVNRSKCSNESMLHFWYKHSFINKGDSFTIKTDKEIQFTCVDYKVEMEYELDSGTYKPDLVVYTDCGNEIVFEMANTNKKKVEDYIDQWIELDKIIVEVDIKNMVNNEKVFNALYYKGKCFNFNKRDGGYYNTIGKLKEQMVSNGKYDIEKIRQLDWFWKEIVKYEMNEVSDFQELFVILDEIYPKLKDALLQISAHRKSLKLLIDYHTYKCKQSYNDTIYKGFIFNTLDTVYNRGYFQYKLQIKDVDESHTTCVLLKSIPNEKELIKYYNDSIEYKEFWNVMNDPNKFKEIFNLYIREYEFESIKCGIDGYKLTTKNKETNNLCTNKFKLRFENLKNLHSKLQTLEGYICYGEMKPLIKDFTSRLKCEHDEIYVQCDYDYQYLHIEIYYGDFKMINSIPYADMHTNRKLFDSYETFKDSFRSCKSISCKNCGKGYSLTLDEWLFFKNSSLEIPKRCRACRQKRKQSK